MHRFALSLVLAASLALAGCGPQLQALQTAVKFGTASIANPVTKERLRQIEDAATILFVGLNAWRDLCEGGAINPDCRQQIRTVQIYTMQVKPYLAQLRRFVKQNDQVNATVVFNQLTDVIAIIRVKGAEGGQNLGGGQ